MVYNEADEIESAIEELVDDDPDHEVLYPRLVSMADHCYKDLERVAMPWVSNLLQDGYILCGAQCLGEDMIIEFEHESVYASGRGNNY
jgi:hypothetical protein